MNRRTLGVIALGALAESCAKKMPSVATIPRPSAPPVTAAPVTTVRTGSVETGMASWYGHPYHGRKAADGEIYDMETLVAAHRTLPFQTVVRVRFLANNKTVDVRIIDRGPFVQGRVIDLSHAAAQAIGLIGPGVGQVEITVLAPPAVPEAALFAVQVGAFREKSNADRMELNMRALYGAGRSVIRNSDPPVWRVLAGRENSTAAAEGLAQRIRAEQKVPEAFVVRLDP